MMNDEKKEAEAAASKVKKYAIALGSCAIIFAVMAMAASNISGSREEMITVTTTSPNMDVEAEVNNVPDERDTTSAAVPDTEKPNDMIEVTEQTNAVTESEAETQAVNAAPTSYTLPLSTSMGRDFSFSVPVYSAVMNDWRTHDGVDFNGAYGDGVKAIADGIVREIRQDTLMGGVAVIDHGGGVVATYCGLDADESLTKGVMVSEGQKIGEVGKIPSESDAEFPHLHLEIRVDGILSDPLDVMNFYDGYSE